LTKILPLSQVWWCIAIIPEFRRLGQEDQEFQASLSHRVKLCLKKEKKICRLTEMKGPFSWVRKFYFRRKKVS
jgi:hypothetical protein